MASAHAVHLARSLLFDLLRGKLAIHKDQSECADHHERHYRFSDSSVPLTDAGPEI